MCAVLQTSPVLYHHRPYFYLVLRYDRLYLTFQYVIITQEIQFTQYIQETGLVIKSVFAGSLEEVPPGVEIGEYIENQHPEGEKKLIFYDSLYSISKNMPNERVRNQPYVLSTVRLINCFDFQAFSFVGSLNASRGQTGCLTVIPT